MQGDLNTLSLTVHIIKVLAPKSPAFELQGLASLKQADLRYGGTHLSQRMRSPKGGYSVSVFDIFSALKK